MYRAVIVDDERKICQLIVELGDWKRYDIEVAAICTDGEEALAAIQRLKPDIVLTDVRMPVYDGLELIRRTNECGLSPAFIIISGYQYFEYAYSAFKYGVIDYLLKPIDQAQLNEVLEKTCGMLARQSAYRQAEDAMRRFREQQETTNRRRLFDALCAPDEDFPQTREELEARYGKRLTKPWLQVLFLRTNRPLDDPNSLLLTEKLQGLLRNTLAGETETPEIFVCSEAVRGGLAAILNMSDESREALYGRLTAFLHDAKETAALFGNTWVCLGLGRVCREVKELPLSEQEAEEAESSRIVLGGNRIVDPARLHFSRIRLEQAAGEGFWNGLAEALESLSQESYSRLLKQVGERLAVTPPVAPEVLRAFSQGVFGAFAGQSAERSDAAGLTEERAAWEAALELADGIGEYLHEMDTRGCAILAEWERQRQNRRKLPIRLAKAWIGEHYGEAVTLELVAGEVGLSPTYFSTHFRQVEGRTFSDYLTSVRMDAARELLSTTAMTNYEIAARIGYADEKYFGKVFKKEVGIRPGEYRKLYLRR